LLKKKFAIIGTGIVGTALAVVLENKGLECIGVNTRSAKSYENFCEHLPKKHLDLAQISLEADLLFITTQDGSISKVAKKLTLLEQRKNAQIWIHCSGSHKSAIMCHDPALQVSYLSIHPLQAFASVENALTLIPGTHFGVEGSDRQSEQYGEQLVSLLGGIPHKIDPEKKTLYHAGAVVASNYLVSLVLMAVKLFEQAGINREDALKSLLPLLHGSYQNIAKDGLARALTGPIARGDTEVVAKHLQEMPPDLQQIYKGLGSLALELGKEKKLVNQTSYSPEALERLEQLLECHSNK
jgi:predicted short-subunit dehydrogenase-like oxidoreductase (DUF2520 family)